MNDSFDPREAAKQAAQQRQAATAQSIAADEQSTPAVLPPAPLAAPVDPTAAMNSQLLQILIQQQARLAAKDQAEEDAKIQRQKQRNKNAQDHTAKDLLRQARCTHLKGGRKGPRSQVRDHAVFIHTFIDSHYEIRCFLCKMIWKINDTAEFLVRHGKKIANHTKIGWYEASKMLESTTNTPSSSEVPLQVTPQAALAQMQD